jgi:hypothetical protein
MANERLFMASNDSEGGLLLWDVDGEREGRRTTDEDCTAWPMFSLRAWNG